MPQVTHRSLAHGDFSGFTLTVRTLTPVGMDGKGRGVCLVLGLEVRSFLPTLCGSVCDLSAADWPHILALPASEPWHVTRPPWHLTHGSIPGGWRSGSCQGGWPHTARYRPGGVRQPVAGGQPHVCEVNLCRGHRVGKWGRGMGQAVNQTTKGESPQAGAQWYPGDFLSPTSPFHLNDVLRTGTSRAHDLGYSPGSVPTGSLFAICSLRHLVGSVRETWLRWEGTLLRIPKGLNGSLQVCPWGTGEWDCVWKKGLAAASRVRL